MVAALLCELKNLQSVHTLGKTKQSTFGNWVNALTCHCNTLGAVECLSAVSSLLKAFGRFCLK